MMITYIEYLDAVKERLTADLLVIGFSIVRERVTLVDGHLRARLTISDGSLLEFSEYVQRSPEDQIEVVICSYHRVAESRVVAGVDRLPAGT